MSSSVREKLICNLTQIDLVLIDHKYAKENISRNNTFPFRNPTPNDLPVRWVPHNKNKLNFLNVGDELKMVPVPNPDELQFWKDIYTKYRRTNVSI